MRACVRASVHTPMSLRVCACRRASVRACVRACMRTRQCSGLLPCCGEIAPSLHGQTVPILRRTSAKTTPPVYGVCSSAMDTDTAQTAAMSGLSSTVVSHLSSVRLSMCQRQYVYVTLPPEMSHMDTFCEFENFAAYYIALISHKNYAKEISKSVHWFLKLSQCEVANTQKCHLRNFRNKGFIVWSLSLKDYLF